MRRISQAFIALTTLLTAANASAYTLGGCAGGELYHWPERSFPIPTRVNETYFPAGNAYRKGIDEAIAAYAVNPSLAYFKKTIGGATSTPLYFTAFVYTADKLPSFHYAYADTEDTIECPSGVISGGAVLFHYYYDDSPDGTKKGDPTRGGHSPHNSINEIGHYNYYYGARSAEATGVVSKIGLMRESFQNVAIHELGHILGLGHVGDVYSVMAPAPHLHNNGTKARAYIGEDTTAALMALYPPGPDVVNNQEDVSVTHWKNIGYSSGFLGDKIGKHGRTALYDGSDNAYFGRFSSDINHLVYRKADLSRIPAKSVVKPEFGFENNGATYNQQDVTMHYYLSSNNFISYLDDPADTLVSSARILNLKRGTDVWYYARPITLPARPPRDASGRTYLGVIVDRNDRIAEFDETAESNATYMVLHIAQSPEELRDILISGPLTPVLP